jgi:hypothetical protein
MDDVPNVGDVVEDSFTGHDMKIVEKTVVHNPHGDDDVYVRGVILDGTGRMGTRHVNDLLENKGFNVVR